MTFFGCRYKCGCPLVGIIFSILAGIVTAFLQITGTITVAPVFLWVVFAVATLYLGVLPVAAALTRQQETGSCLCLSLGTLLVGILGSILLSVVLLAVGIVATSILSAILVGILLAFFFLMLTATACLVRSLFDCGS